MTKTSKFHLNHGEGGTAIAVHIVRRAGKTVLIRVTDEGTIHIQLAGPETNDHCNQELLDYLAGILKVSVKQLEIVGGEKGDDKIITILHLDSAAVEERILAVLN
jgi:uncharacterized protein YggU (UPF0235/DUF167 family)